jgi:hypothetical protein
MLVQVKWKNGDYDYVRDFMLDSLLEIGVVDSFLRSSGWVTIGVDPVRSSALQRGYNGPERRTILSPSAAPDYSPR